MMFIIVLLPDPDGPTIATNSPRLDVEVDIAQRGDGDVAHVVGAADPRRLMIGRRRRGVTRRHTRCSRPREDRAAAAVDGDAAAAEAAAAAVGAAAVVAVRPRPCR